MSDTKFRVMPPKVVLSVAVPVKTQTLSFPGFSFGEAFFPRSRARFKFTDPFPLTPIPIACGTRLLCFLPGQHSSAFQQILVFNNEKDKHKILT
jgi:hypothetical protein